MAKVALKRASALLWDKLSAVIEECGFARFDMAGLVAFLLAAVWTCLAFWFGARVSGATFWMALALGGLFAAMRRSWKNLACYVALMGGVWLLTAFSFSYVMIDPAICHFPLAQAMVEGWNPVLEGTTGGFKRYIPEVCGVEWILAAPKLGGVVSAIVSKGTGLFTAAMFMQFLVFFAAIPCAARFSEVVLGTGRKTGVAFAIAALIPLGVAGRLFCGYADWLKTSATLAMLFCAFTWWQSRRKSDLAAFVVMALVAAASKTQALPAAVLACIIVFARARSLRLFFGTLAIALVLNASPFLSQWFRGGSPFYPAHSFLPYVETTDLTRDFTAPEHFNADFRMMGRIARVCRAWFSEDLAYFASGLWYRRDYFNPISTGINLAGFGRNFRIWMVLSLLALPFCRKNRGAILFAGAVFALCNVVMPVKYLGYGRYFLEMQTVPMAILLAAAQTHPRTKALACPAIAAAALFLACLAGKSYMANLKAEAIRQDAYAQIRAKGILATPGDIGMDKFAATIDRRMRAAGLKVADVPNAQRVDFRQLNPWSHDMVPVTGEPARHVLLLPRIVFQPER